MKAWLSESFRLTHQCFGAVLRRFWPWLVGLGIISIALDEYTFEMQKLMDQFDSPPMVLLGALLGISLLWEVLSGILVIILASIGARDALRSQPPTSIWEISRVTLKPLTIESLRAMGKALLWSFLLIVPGLIKYIRFTFVPYIVLFEQDYRDGKVDALERSEVLVSGHTWALALIIAVYFMAIGIFYASIQGLQNSFLENPIGTIVAQCFFQIMSLYFAIFLFAIYESLNRINRNSQESGDYK
jgi:hypothetical protein